MDSPRTLLEEVSPNGNIAAIVEEDDRAVYLYLQGAPDSGVGMRSCWVRNLGTAPESLDVEAMKEGLAPALPARFCTYPNGSPALKPGTLELVWSEDGTGAALLDRGELLAFLPPALDGVPGHARDCTAANALCQPMGPKERAEVEQASAFWKEWSGDPWPELQDRILAAYAAALGPRVDSVPIDGGAFPPRLCARFERGGRAVLVTVGMSIRPQPRAGRIELAIAVAPELATEALVKYLGAQSALPWARNSFLAEGHTISCEGVLAGFRSVKLAPTDEWNLGLPEYRGQPVQLLRLIPLP
jgi:hypothetical protein